MKTITLTPRFHWKNETLYCGNVALTRVEPCPYCEDYYVTRDEAFAGSFALLAGATWFQSSQYYPKRDYHHNLEILYTKILSGLDLHWSHEKGMSYRLYWTAGYSLYCGDVNLLWLVDLDEGINTAIAGEGLEILFRTKTRRDWKKDEMILFESHVEAVRDLTPIFKNVLKELNFDGMAISTDFERRLTKSQRRASQP